MMVENEDLRLSLSLSFGVSSNPNSLQLPSPPFNKPSWTDAFTSSDRRCLAKGIDVNCSPEEEEGESSPNSTISSVSGKRSEEERERERGSSISISDEDDGENGRKKLRLSKDQSAVLEESFKEHNTLNPKQKMGLAKRLGLRPRQVEVWFQNRRARTKLKQTEVDCEFLKRCSENLREENRRLQKEVQELRALKLSPHLYMQMTPPTTLTICPSCDTSLPRPIAFTSPWPSTPIPHFHAFRSRSRS